MSRADRVWARHYQDDWQSRAGDPRLPHWLRVAALAFGSHSDNGHARFRRGEVALVLGRVDEQGVVRPYANVRRAITEAVQYGWLEEGSYWACLIVPAHAVRKGELYATPAPCPLQPKHKEKSPNRSLSERNESLKPTLSERFELRSAHSANGSQRESLLSVLSTVPTHQPPSREASAPRRRRPAS